MKIILNTDIFYKTDFSRQSRKKSQNVSFVILNSFQDLTCFSIHSCHSEFISESRSESQETLKHVQGDCGIVQGDKN